MFESVRLEFLACPFIFLSYNPDFGGILINRGIIMKQNVLFLLLVILLAVSCTSHKNEVVEEEPVPVVVEEVKEEVIVPGNDITGLIKVGDNNRICIVENWESESPVEYYIARDYEDAFREKVDHIIRVRGEIKKKYSTSKYAIQINTIIYVN